MLIHRQVFLNIFMHMNPVISFDSLLFPDRNWLLPLKIVTYYLLNLTLLSSFSMLTSVTCVDMSFIIYRLA